MAELGLADRLLTGMRLCGSRILLTVKTLKHLDCTPPCACRQCNFSERSFHF